jgi:hypothetical protein
VPSRSSFWEHDPLRVEPIWQEFVRLVGGKLVADLVPEPRNFENADFVFPEVQVVAELKEIRTDFSASDAFRRSLDSLLRRLIAEDPSWRPALFGGSREYPKWFNIEFARIFRPHVSRLLKKANRQLRETKMHFGIQAPTGVLLMVNDAFTAIGPNQVMAVAANALSQAYSSIDCLVYLTVNRYIELVGSDTCRLMWVPVYSDRAPESLVAFIDDLGHKWFVHLEQMIGPFSWRDAMTQDRSAIRGARPIVRPNEKHH